MFSDYWNSQELTSAQVVEVRRLLCAWTRFDLDTRDTLELALARLASSMQRGRGRFWMQDRILDIAVALEMMFAPLRGGLAYKLSLRAAHLLGDEAKDRIMVCEAVKQFYTARSRIVHGNGGKKRGNGKEAREDLERGYEIGRKTLVKLLEREADCAPSLDIFPKN